MDGSKSSNGWEEWKNHLLNELKRLNSEFTHLNSKLDEINTSVNEKFFTLSSRIQVVEQTSKLHTAIWGALAGLGGSAVLAIFLHLINK